MDGAVGYEYDYKMCAAFGLSDSYKLKELVVRTSKWFLFEFRTKFILKKLSSEEEDELIGSETFEVCPFEIAGKYWLLVSGRFRLEDYWMTDAQMSRLSVDAYVFAMKVRKDLGHTDLLTIPVAIDLEVRTVQLENESVSAARERSINPEVLVPLHYWPHTMASERMGRRRHASPFLYMTPRLKVENVEEVLTLMPLCDICGRKPNIGTRITVLRCGHIFHSHCLVPRLLESVMHMCPGPGCGRIATPVIFKEEEMRPTLMTSADYVTISRALGIN